jgi:hypothetical protein
MPVILGKGGCFRFVEPDPEPEPEEVNLVIREIEPEPEPEIEYTTKSMEVVKQFIKDKVEPAEDTVRVRKTEIFYAFDKWLEEHKITDFGDNNHELWTFLETKYTYKNLSYYGVRLKYTEEEKLRVEIEKQMRADANKREKEERERENARSLLETVVEETQSVEGEDEEETTGLDEIVYKGKTIHRHPEYKTYGGCLETGEMFRLKKDKVVNEISTSLEKGCILSLGYEDGKRKQKYITNQQFIAECGNLPKQSEFHTKLKIDTGCSAYLNRPNIKCYPLACLSYIYDGGIKVEGEVPINKLVSKCRTTKQIDEYMTELKSQYKAELKKKDDEIAKLKSRVSQLEAQNQKLNTPLSAGALQLQDLLMTRVGETDTTFKDMLQFCFKDITRDYPIQDDEESFLSDTSQDERNDACFGVFEMSPTARGLPYDNEHITEQVG